MATVRLHDQLAQGTDPPAARRALIAKIAEVELCLAEEQDILGELGVDGAFQVIGRASAALSALEDYRAALTTRGLWHEPEREREVDQQRTDVWRRITRVQQALRDAQRRL